MKAAAVAAEREHAVTLCESGDRLGGQALLAQLLPDRAEFGGLVTNLESEIARCGVDVRRRLPVTQALVEQNEDRATRGCAILARMQQPPSRTRPTC